MFVLAGTQSWVLPLARYKLSVVVCAYNTGPEETQAGAPVGITVPVGVPGWLISLNQ